MAEHVTSLFLQWLDGTIDDRRVVDDHLRHCPACSAYYAKMSALLTPAQSESIALRPDPYLPARIRSRATGSERRPAYAVLRPALRWSGAGALVALAVFLGITLGKDLAPKTKEYTTTDIVSTYYSAVSQQNFSARLESAVSSAQKEKQ